MAKLTAMIALVWMIIIPKSIHAQISEIKLWSSFAPGTEKRVNTERWNEKKELFDVDQPRMTVFLPKKRVTKMPAIIVCPGGGYRKLCVEKEGNKIARWLNTNGIAAFVLLYRLKPSEALQDIRRAVSVLRLEAGKYNIDGSKIGIIGFSAGAHLAANLVTHFRKADFHDRIDSISSRPDYWIGVYGAYEPVPEVEGIDRSFFSFTPFFELISQETPPTFLVHAGNDPKAPVLHSVHLYEALQKQGVPAELHIYEQGGHGFALEVDRGDAITSTVRSWSKCCIDWLKVRGITKGRN